MSPKIHFLLLCALMSATAAVASPPVEALLDRADQAWRAGQFDQAEAGFKEAVAADPQSSLAHARLASFYLTRRRTEEAISEFQEAITQDPENARLFVGLAIAYLHRRSYGMAQAMVRRALELDPGLANARKLDEYVTARRKLLTEAPGRRTGTTGAPATK